MTNKSLHKTTLLMRENKDIAESLRYNEFSQDIEFTCTPEWNIHAYKGKKMDDNDIIELQYYLANIYDYEPNRQKIGDAFYMVASRHSYHPIKRYIESTEWDGKSRLTHWLSLSAGCEDNAYTRLVAERFLIGAVSRVYNPGCKFDHMMILEGAQGIGKSTLVEVLAGEWYLDTNFDHRDKDLVDAIRTAFIIEVSELGGMNKKDIDWLKAFLSKKVDRVRLPYAQHSKDFHRKCVFIGTYNPSGYNQYLRDDTGNRRFWVIECGDINIGWMRDNRDQLWAEALHLYKEGNTKLYIDEPEALSILSSIHGDREMSSPTYYHLQDWLNLKEVVTMNEIIEEGMGIAIKGRSPRDLLSAQTTAGINMKKLGWLKGKNDNRNKYYAPTQTITNEVVWDE